ncbi:MAG: hypothetical protein Q9178_005752 [Gyalolechia marmorata]
MERCYFRLSQWRWQPQWERVFSRPWTRQPPKKLKSLADVRQPQIWSYTRLRIRDITPRTECFLVQYDKSAKLYLSKPSDIRKAVLDALHKVLHSKTILAKAQDFGIEHAAQTSHMLQKLRYFAKYGDYASEYCLLSRSAASEGKTPGYEVFTEKKSWHDVQLELNKEAAAIEAAQVKSEERPKTPMTTAIESACIALNFDHSLTRYAIAWYAERNANSHSNVINHIKACDWQAIGQQLFRHLHEIPRVLGEKDQVMMRRTLEFIKDRYFVELRPTISKESAAAECLTAKKKAKEQRLEDEDRKKQLDPQPKVSASKERDSNEVVDEKRKEREGKKSNGSSWDDDDEEGLLGFF